MTIYLYPSSSFSGPSRSIPTWLHTLRGIGMGCRISGLFCSFVVLITVSNDFCNSFENEWEIPPYFYHGLYFVPTKVTSSYPRLLQRSHSLVSILHNFILAHSTFMRFTVRNNQDFFHRI